MQLLFAALHPFHLQRSFAMTPLRQRMLEEIGLWHDLPLSKVRGVHRKGPLVERDPCARRTAKGDGKACES